MGRSGVSREQVERAVDTLRAAGATPTVRAVREQLGDTGSLKTISDHLRALRAAAWGGPGPALPDPLLQKLVDGASEYWVELADAADVTIARAEEEADKRVAHAEAVGLAAEQQTAVANGEIEAQRATVTALERHLADREQDLSSTRGSLHEAQNLAASLETNVTEWRAATEARQHELDASRKALDAARLDLNKLTENLQTAEAAHRQALAGAEDAREELREEIATLKESLTTARAEIRFAEREREKLSSERDALTRQQSSMQTTIDRALEQRDTEIATRKAVEDALEAERRKQDARESSLSEALDEQRRLAFELGQKLDAWMQLQRVDNDPARRSKDDT